MKIYLASSWRNIHQPEVLRYLRAIGCQVYDFRHPTPTDAGFSWSEIDEKWIDWTGAQFRDALATEPARRGYAFDWNAMNDADVGVLLLPCGRSAHLEAGYFVGAGKPLIILLQDKNEPELMYKMATNLCLDVPELIEAVRSLNSPRAI